MVIGDDDLVVVVVHLHGRATALDPTESDGCNTGLGDLVVAGHLRVLSWTYGPGHRGKASNFGLYLWIIKMQGRVKIGHLYPRYVKSYSTCSILIESIIFWYINYLP